MSLEESLPLIADGDALGRHVTRRMMVQRLLAGAGAGAAWPLVAISHPIHELLSNDAILDEAEKLSQTDWKPVFLSSQQNELLTAIAESIVPGSNRARVNRFIDLLLSVDKPENQHKFVESLAALDEEALKQFSKSFPVLNEEQKNTLFSEASTKPETQNASAKETSGKQSVLYGHFANLKHWVSGAYYSSEVGMRELGWTGNYAFAEFPGCSHPEGHH